MAEIRLTAAARSSVNTTNSASGSPTKSGAVCHSETRWAERKHSIPPRPPTLEALRQPSAGFTADRLLKYPVHFGRLEDTRKGNRPSFTDAARPEAAEPIYEAFCRALEREGVRVVRGIFGARMEVALVNDGPVTIVLELPPDVE